VSSRDITSARRHSTSTNWTEPETPLQRDQFDTSDLAPIGGNGGGVGPGPSPSLSSRGLRRDRRQSDMSALSADLGLRYTYVPHPCRRFDAFIDSDPDSSCMPGAHRRELSLFRDSSFSSEDYDVHDNVLASMQNSTWGGEFQVIPTPTGAGI
jgi:hypothetical protein